MHSNITFFVNCPNITVTGARNVSVKKSNTCIHACLQVTRYFRHVTSKEHRSVDSHQLSDMIDVHARAIYSMSPDQGMSRDLYHFYSDLLKKFKNYFP